RRVAPQRWNRRNGIAREWITPTFPVTKDRLRERERLRRSDVAGDDDRRVVRHVVAPLNGPHLLRCRAQDDRALTERILPTPSRRPERFAHGGAELKQWAGF